jgi:ribosomal protein L18E
MRKITLKMVLMLGVLVVLIVSVAGCTSSPSSNQTASSTTQTPSATSSATTQHNAFLEKFLTAYKNEVYSDSNTQVQAWELDWINSTSAHVQLTGLNKTLHRTVNIDETIVVFPTTQDATNYVSAVNLAAYRLASTESPSGGAYQNATGHAPQVYKEYLYIEGNSLNISEYRIHEIQQADNLVAVQTGKVLS